MAFGEQEIVIISSPCVIEYLDLMEIVTSRFAN